MASARVALCIEKTKKTWSKYPSTEHRSFSCYTCLDLQGACRQSFDALRKLLYESLGTRGPAARLGVASPVLFIKTPLAAPYSPPTL
eukprot:16852-Heterococcus_DN1.PRE.2